MEGLHITSFASRILPLAPKALQIPETIHRYQTLRKDLAFTPPTNKTTAPFKKTWSDLSVAENELILLKARRIVIPNSKIEGILLSLIHI